MRPCAVLLANIALGSTSQPPSAVAEELVQALLDRIEPEPGARSDVDVRDHNGVTLLGHAAGLGNTAAIALLVQRGAAIDAVDGFGMTPLHRAAEGGMLDACRVLLAHGANTAARDDLKLTPADIAHAWGYPQVAELLGHPSPWSGTRTSAGREPPFNADGTEEPKNPRWKREL